MSFSGFTRTIVAAITVCCLSDSEATADILPGNFLPNPSFELDDDGDGIPDGWLKGGNNSAGDLWEMESPVSGEYHATLLDESDVSYTTWYTNVMLPADTEEISMQWTWNYLFTSDNAGDEFRMTIAWRAEDTDIGFDHVVVREDQPDYVTENRDWLVPDGADALRLEFVTAGPQAETGIMQIDDVSIAVTGAVAAGDFNGDGVLDAADIDLLSAAVRTGNNPASFDLNGDAIVDGADRITWVDELRQTYMGDSDLDGVFGTSDLVAVFTAGQYEDAVSGNSTWATGDWNGDSDFTSSDFVFAISNGCFEGGCNGPRAATAAVPEPNSMLLLLLGATCCFGSRRFDSIVGNCKI